MVLPLCFVIGEFTVMLKMTVKWITLNITFSMLCIIKAEITYYAVI